LNNGREILVLYNVAQLLKAPVGTSLEYDIHEEDVQLDEDLKVIGPIEGRVRLHHTNQGILADGQVELTLELTCMRCLKEFEHPMHLDFSEVFYPTVDVTSGVPVPPMEEEVAFPIDEHHQLDLTEAIRQNILVSLPMVPICREDCTGLCPQCGKDLNSGPCECKPEVDTRFSVLEQLLRNGSES
jgi:uncharacterized protein